MGYRDNELGNALREQYEVAKADLEDLANSVEINFLTSLELVENKERMKLEENIEAMGFRRKILTHGFIDEIGLYKNTVVYARENSNGLEVLANRDLAQDLNDRKKRIKSELHLYQLPADQNVLEWYDSLYEKKEQYRGLKKQDTSGLALGWFTVTISGSGLLLASPSMAGCIIGGAALAALTYGSLVAKQKVEESSVLDKQTLAKGSDALQYIANNTSFEDFVRYQAPRFEDVIDITDDVELIEDITDDQEIELIEEVMVQRK